MAELVGSPIYRIYTCDDDFGGWHTALYYSKNSANDYFKDMKEKHPNAMMVAEVIDDETGDIVSRKVYNEKKSGGLTIDEMKAMRQEYVSVLKYNIEWRTTQVAYESVSPDEAGQIMIDATKEDGYGTEWIYIVKHCPIVETINWEYPLPKSILMKV